MRDHPHDTFRDTAAPDRSWAKLEPYRHCVRIYKDGFDIVMTSETALTFPYIRV